MQEYLDGADVARVKKQSVLEGVTRGALINLLGLGSTLVGVQTLVGVLVAKTLTNASVNPFMASAAGSYNPVLALDVFLVQVGCVGCFFVCCVCSCFVRVCEGVAQTLTTKKKPKTTNTKPTKKQKSLKAATNTLLGHFLSLACALWLLNVVGEGRGLRFQVAV